MRVLQLRSVAGCLLAGAVLGFAGLAATDAGAGNSGPIDGTKYYESFEETKCADDPYCGLEFDRVPDNAVFRATNLSCFIRIAPSNKNVPVLFLSQTQGRPSLQEKMTISSTAVNPTPLDVDGLVFITNQEILSFFDPKSRPAITVSDSNASISCKISGDLVPVR